MNKEDLKTVQERLQYQQLLSLRKIEKNVQFMAWLLIIGIIVSLAIAFVNS